MDAFYALAEPNRRRIVELLAKHGQLSASSISRQFPVSAAAISQHLKVLREAKLVHMQKRGQKRIYELNTAAITDLETWAQETTALWNKRFDSLEHVLEAQTKRKKGAQL